MLKKQCPHYGACTECGETVDEIDENGYNRGWNDALDAAELQLRRFFQKLWPHDQHCAEILAKLRKI